MPPGPRIVVLRTYGTAAHLAGDPERGAAALLEALELAQSADDRRAEAQILGDLGDLRFDQMRLDEAQATTRRRAGREPRQPATGSSKPGRCAG